VVAVRGTQLLVPSSATAAAHAPANAPTPSVVAPAPLPRREPRVVPGAPPGAQGEADGAVPEGTTVFDDDVPGVANLDPALLRAVRRAATGAEGDGIELHVDSGWRSAAYQERLLREAISKYGSAEEAARWVASPQTSLHVSGDAVDLGPARATSWLARHGATYGLCQIYRNEPWHYELRPAAVDEGCPRPYADPSHDPRLQQ
jgi:hypothetical protein